MPSFRPEKNVWKSSARAVMLLLANVMNVLSEEKHREMLLCKYAYLLS